MLTSLSFIFLLGLFMAQICQKCRLPSIIGMLVTGVVLGPYALNALDSSILLVSADLRKMALVIILLRAGLALSIDDLKKAGRPAVLMSFVPASCEILGYTLLAPYLLGINVVEAVVMGSVMAAVSPAVVVPRMVRLIEKGYGRAKGIPQAILAGCSCDDIFVLVVFATFSGMALGGAVHVMDFVNIPESIILGIILGTAVGMLLSIFFESAYKHKSYIRNSVKVVIILGVSFLLVSIEEWLKDIVAVSGFLAVVSLACTLKLKTITFVSKRLSEKFGKLWIAAELILFVLVGAAFDIKYTMEAGVAAIVMILAALLFRSMGVYICFLGTNLSFKEKLFCMIAYLPKATVQAAIGSVPLAMGLPCGKLVLSVAVLGIAITAPLGAIGIDASYQRLLSKE